jgi:methane monooxygenase PmoA-like
MSTIRSIKRTGASLAECLAGASLVACLVLSMLAAGVVAQEPFEIEDRGETITVSSADRPVLEYQFTSKPKKSYVSRLFSPAGVQIIRDAPHDHLHHHSLMFAVAVDGVNFWEENDACGRQKPVGKAVTKTASGDGSASATIEHRLNWMAPNASDVLLIESRTVEVLRTEKPGPTMLVWKCRLSPPPGKKSVTLTGSAYFGLGARFTESMDAGGRFQNADGKTGVEDTNDKRSAWCAYSAKADGKPVTVAMFDCPKNPRHPATWFTMDSRFAYLAATLDLSKQPLVVEAGKPLELRYGVALWDGQVSIDQIHATYRGFSK